jgi:hypothetical protein
MGGRSSSSGMSVNDKIDIMKSYKYADPGDVKNLIPLASEDDIKQANRQLNDARKNGTLSYEEREVNIKDLTTRQEWVTQNKLKSMNEEFVGKISGRVTDTSGGIRAIPHNNQFIIIDGNHRVNLAVLRGQKRILIRVARYEK